MGLIIPRSMVRIHPRLNKGAVAQMVEHLLSVQKVRGSIPFSSTYFLEKSISKKALFLEKNISKKALFLEKRISKKAHF